MEDILDVIVYSLLNISTLLSVYVCFAVNSKIEYHVKNLHALLVSVEVIDCTLVWAIEPGGFVVSVEVIDCTLVWAIEPGGFVVSIDGIDGTLVWAIEPASFVVSVDLQVQSLRRKYHQLLQH
jgi:hypothetical protein